MIVVGGLPEPSGGVTNFVFRLANHFRSSVDEIADLYPHARKWSLPGVPVSIRPRGRIASLAWLVRLVGRLRTSDAYFNFSSRKFLYLAPFLPKGRGRKWLLTLHHGQLLGVGERAPPFAWWLKLSLRKFDRVGAIGKGQAEFYSLLGVPAVSTVAITPYLPYVAPPSSSASDLTDLDRRLAEISARGGKIVVASGYPTVLYQHDWLLEYSKSATGDFQLILCLYGKDSEGRLDTFRQAAGKDARLHLFEGLMPDAFQRVLQAADVYARPTLIDSFGIAVAEALAMGVAVVASDACDRPEGACIFAKNDKAAFFSLLDQQLERGGRFAIPDDANLAAVRELLTGRASSSTTANARA